MNNMRFATGFAWMLCYALAGCGGGGTADSSSSSSGSSGSGTVTTPDPTTPPVVTPPVVTPPVVTPPVVTPPVETPPVVPPVQYTISTVVSAGGRVSPSTVTVEQGGKTTLFITTDTYYRLASVTGCNGQLASNTITITNVSANCTVDIQFTDQRTAPTDLTSSVSNAVATVRWTGNTLADGYLVRVADGSVLSGQTPIDWITTQSVSGTSIQLPLIKSYNHLYITVAARYGARLFPASSEVQASLNFQAPAQLNDTATSQCFDAQLKLTECSASSLNRQDGLVGRDSAANAKQLTKKGQGMAGFDFTKIASNGADLSQQGQSWNITGTEASGQRWSCVRDNISGLVWEIKQNDGPQRADQLWRWYNSDNQRNGGNAGTSLANDTLSCGLASCTTQAYIEHLNNLGWCGSRHWRLPTRHELTSLLVNRATQPAIDTALFPTQLADQLLWTDTTYAGDTALAWVLSANSGISLWQHKSTPQAVWLVHSE